MTKLEQTISLLARHGIYSLVDMHQDAMNEVFAGEGFPNWAVCTDGITPVAYRNVAAWGVNQIDAGMAQAQGHFWTNDVVGNLQGAYDQIWAKVASRLAGNPWVIGYDPFNEPFSPSIIIAHGSERGVRRPGAVLLRRPCPSRQDPVGPADHRLPDPTTPRPG